jgi:hypothetical protein
LINLKGFKKTPARRGRMPLFRPLIRGLVHTGAMEISHKSQRKPLPQILEMAAVFELGYPSA